MSSGPSSSSGEQRSYRLNTKALTTCPSFQPWATNDGPSWNIFPMYAMRILFGEGSYKAGVSETLLQLNGPRILTFASSAMSRAT